MSDNKEVKEITWNDLQKDIEELDRFYTSVNPEENFEIKLIEKAKKHQLEIEQLRKIFNEYYNEKRKLNNLDKWLEKTPYLSLIQRLSTVIGVITLLLSAITFIPTQQEQKRISIQKNKIDTDRSHYEAWSIINNNNKVQASSGRVTALQNLIKDRIPLDGLEVPGAFLFNVDFRGAKLYRANFQGADLYRSDFSSKPQQSNPKQCNWWILDIFADCKPEEELQKRKTELERANFRGATLYEAKFNDSDSIDKKQNEEPDVDIYRADFSSFYLTEKKEGKQRQEEDQKYCEDKYPNDSNAKNECLVQKLLETECFLNKPVIQCTRAVNTEFIGANLKYADFTKASAKGANFSHADLECASFRGAIFNKEQDQSKDLRDPIKPTNFTKANLKGADFRDLAISTKGDPKRGILPEQIKKATDWKQAKYSEAFKKELGLSKQDEPHDCEVFQK